METTTDIAVIGGGPAGAVCATLCARHGYRVTILERAAFPRHKVCGDCLNPACWDVFDELGISEAVRRLPHAELHRVVFESIGGAKAGFPLPADPSRPEIACRRELLDAMLLATARDAGCEVIENAPVTSIERLGAGTGSDNDNDNDHWRITHALGECRARWIVAADGRNSVTARLLKLVKADTVPVASRVAWQTHAPLPPGAPTDSVTLRFLKHGYCGAAPVGDGLLNICLVAPPASGPASKQWAVREYNLAGDAAWSSITPLQRADYPVAGPGWLLIGDAARVVEPFTGEGIYYALASGRLAAHALRLSEPAATAKNYAAAHSRLYSGQLWINRLTRLLVSHPSTGSRAVSLMRCLPSPAGFLLGRVTRR